MDSAGTCQMPSRVDWVDSISPFSFKRSSAFMSNSMP